MKPRLSLTVITSIGVVMASLSPLSYALRCGAHVIADDAHISDVLEKCGEPLSEINKKEYVTTYIQENSRSVPTTARSDLSVGREVTREIQITEFIYDFGLERFKRKLQFVDGHLNKVTQLNRGSPR